MKAGKRAEFREGLERLIVEYEVVSIQELDSIGHGILLRKAIAKNKTNRETAKELGIGKSTMYRKLKEYGIESKT